MYGYMYKIMYHAATSNSVIKDGTATSPDVFLAGLLGRVVELEGLLIKKQMKEERKTMDRIKKFFHN